MASDERSEFETRATLPPNKHGPLSPAKTKADKGPKSEPEVQESRPKKTKASL